jgi:hypothetical protein
MELRKFKRRSLCRRAGGGHAATPFWSGEAVLPESREHVQTGNWGSSGTWEILLSPPVISGVGCCRTQRTRPTGMASFPDGSKRKDARRVPPNEGNEVRWDGLQEVVAP